MNGHRSIYCSCDSDCDDDAVKLRTGLKQADGTYKFGLESLLNQYGVDMWFNGHEHNYERMYDVEPLETFDYLAGTSQQTTTNPPGPIYIVTGDAGNGENHKPFVYPQPSRTAYRTVTFGYGSMTVYNSSHLFWQQIGYDHTVDPIVEGGVLDSFWLIQNNHGPFVNKSVI